MADTIKTSGEIALVDRDSSITGVDIAQSLGSDYPNFSSGQVNLSDFYRGGTYFPTDTDSGIPTSGQIQFSDFYGEIAEDEPFAWGTSGAYYYAGLHSMFSQAGRSSNSGVDSNSTSADSTNSGNRPVQARSFIKLVFGSTGITWSVVDSHYCSDGSGLPNTFGESHETLGAAGTSSTTPTSSVIPYSGVNDVQAMEFRFEIKNWYTSYGGAASTGNFVEVHMDGTDTSQYSDDNTYRLTTGGGADSNSNSNYFPNQSGNITFLPQALGGTDSNTLYFGLVARSYGANSGQSITNFRLNSGGHITLRIRAFRNNGTRSQVHIRKSHGTINDVPNNTSITVPRLYARSFY